MKINPSYILKPANKKREAMISYAMADKFMAGVMHDLTDFGYDIGFSIKGGAGAYQPFALSTEKVDSHLKQQQFSSGFWSMVEAGNIKAKLRFSALLGAQSNAHSFLHELMHFYQDMQGLYLLPLQEQGEFPVFLDAKSDIVAYLFCEAWAEVEAIRTSWALREKGHVSGWDGALSSPDWGALARKYDGDMQGGADEKRAAADAFMGWYEGAHRKFYETHALKIHESNFARYKDGAGEISDHDIELNMRSLELPMLLARLPKGGIPSYFAMIDWDEELYSQIQTPSVVARIEELEGIYGKPDNPNIQEIKCGSPPYLWNRLRLAEQRESEVPPH